MLNRLSTTILEKFPYFIGGYFLLQILIRLITTSGVVIDESEQVMLSQFFSLGYNAQPPLYTWLQIIFFEIFGRNIFAIALLKNLTLFSIYIFTYKAAYEVSQDTRKAALSSLGLVYLPQILWEAQIDQIHTVLLTASAAALFYFYFKTANSQSIWGYIGIGLAAGCGILAKYNYVVVLFALFVATIAIAEYRKTILNKKIFISATILLLSISPHVLWFYNNLDLATHETLNRMSMDQQGNYFSDVLHGSLDLVLAYIAFSALFLLAYFFLFRKQFCTNLSPAAKLLSIYILTTFLSVFVIIWITQATNIKERWLQPFLFLLPMLFFAASDIKKHNEEKAVNYFTNLSLLFCTIVMLVIPLRVILVDFDSKPHRENYPFRALAAAISSQFPTPQLILAEDKFIGGNLKLFFNNSIVITPSIPLQHYDAQGDVLIVWKQHNPIEYLKDKVHPTGSHPWKTELPYRFSQKYKATFYARSYTFQTEK